MSRRPSEHAAGRQALESFVTARLGRPAPRPATPAKPAEPKRRSLAGAQDFENLPGYRELKLQRSAAELIGPATLPKQPSARRLARSVGGVGLRQL